MATHNADLSTPRHRYRLAVAPELLLEFVKVGTRETFEVVENGVPADAEVVGVELGNDDRTVWIWFSTNSRRPGDLVGPDWPAPVIQRVPTDTRGDR